MYYNLAQSNKVDIDKIIKAHGNVTILYYSDMCGHCIQLKPVWAKICKKIATSHDIIIINVEANNLNQLKPKYRSGINGFPTILKHNKGKRVAEYQGNRTMADIVRFIKK
jgi:thiol-disulfide isomerase/thioredoxin